MISVIIAAVLLVSILLWPSNRDRGFSSSFLGEIFVGVGKAWSELWSESAFRWGLKAFAIASLAIFIAGKSCTMNKNVEVTKPTTTAEKIIVTTDKGIDIYNAWKK